MLFIERIDKPTKDPKFNIIKEVLKSVTISKTIKKALQLNINPIILITPLKGPVDSKIIIFTKRLNPLIKFNNTTPNIILPK